MLRRVLLLDFDGTLFDAARVYREAMAEVGLEMNSEEYCQVRDIVKKRMGHHTSNHHRLIYFKTLMERRGGFSVRKLMDLYESYERAVEKAVGRQAESLGLPRQLQTLSELFDITLITNETLRTQMVKIRAVDPDGKFFKHIVVSEEVAHEKPDQRFYDYAIRVAGLTEQTLNQAWLVGDDLEWDIAPGARLGMRVFWQTQFLDERARAKEPPSSVKRLSSLQDFIDLASA